MRFISRREFYLADLATTMAIVSAGVYYTNRIDVSKFSDFAIDYIAAGTTPDLKIEIEQGLNPPATEYAASTDWIEGVSVNDIETNLTATTRKHKSATANINPFKWVRLKITGNGGNGADSTLKAALNMQEET